MDPIERTRTPDVSRHIAAPVRPAFGDLAGRLGEEIAAPLSAALERVMTLSAAGGLHQGTLGALREDIERVRRVGIMVQQLGRFAAGHVRQIPEPLDLTQMLRDALRQRARESEARGIEIRQLLAPAGAIADASLVFSLLQALLDWCFECSRSRIDFRIETRPWPVQARLLASFAWRDEDRVDSTMRASFEAGDDKDTGPLDSMAWQLLMQIADTLGLQLERELSPWMATVQLEFPPADNDLAPRLDDTQGDDAGDAPERPLHSRPPAGSHVLVVASRRELRNLARESLRRLGLMLDFADSTDAAREFCSHAMPHAVVYEAALGGMEALRKRLLAELPSLVFIRLAEEGHSFEVSRNGNVEIATVGRDAIVTSLPAALSYELGRVV